MQSNPVSTQGNVGLGTKSEVRFDVRVATVVFRIVRGELSVGLPIASRGDGTTARSVPIVAPNAGVEGLGLTTAAQLAASRAVSAREIVRVSPAGVRALRTTEGAPSADTQSIYLVSWAIARPVATTAGTAQSVEAEESFVPIPALSSTVSLDDTSRALVGCAFAAFLDATLADALTRRLLPRHVLFRKTDGFDGRSPYETIIGADQSESRPTDDGPATPIFVGLLPDPFPLSSLREFYEHLLGAPLDRGNFRRQFQEIIAQGPVKALPIYERGVPHRAGQLFTFDRSAWSRFASKA